MAIIINNFSMVPIYEQVVDQLKRDILSGKLAENAALPSVRVLSAELRISALTVKKAYDKLEQEGFVTTIHGKGTYVSPADRSLAMEARRKAVEDAFAVAVERARAVGLTAQEIRDIVDIMLEESVW